MNYHADRPTAAAQPSEATIDFLTSPDRYRHWKLIVNGDIAELVMDVNENAPLMQGYQLKLNSYDLGVDIELSDALQRLRFEHPGVKVVLLKSGKDKVFCAGANIRMLAAATHVHKVNFCKFTNETRNSMEDSSENTGLKFLCAIRGTAAGGGYELALSCDYIILSDDGSSSVSLPEVPLLAVLPGTGGLTRVTDKRKVRRDRADIFCTVEEGIKGKRAVEWRLVDEVVANSKFEAAVQAAAASLAAKSDRPAGEPGVSLTPLARDITTDRIAYSLVHVEFDRAARRATITVSGPQDPVPASVAEAKALGAQFYSLRVARELDDAIVHLRLNEPEIGTWVFRTEGDADLVCAYDRFLEQNSKDWFIRETLHFWKRVLKRIDVTSRSLVALIETGSCFAGSLAEIAFACDRSYMFAGTVSGGNQSMAHMTLTPLNFGPYPMSNGLTRLETRFLGEPETVQKAKGKIGESLDSSDAELLGLVTESFDEVDWDDEVRIFLEERTSFSPDGLVGLEANLRFAGPETMETKIFGRLTAWQNWIFQRPNAVGADGALKRYGTGLKPDYDIKRV
ncbi:MULTISPECIES: 2,3-epoxybenzoyl-CoA dihydrolase [unclassified Beijerinckia]|uniref:2,3-epoxybenzoyl-CoA dihydrolase n=1 Tax=unclassified Beijerinckia TaxID=2638183 RepID=UPI00089478D5|nr:MULTISPECIES: 2,3-epoxybenzoyl-CoA dihydrolase [unclassified Beijerinckia]MDH7798628.1 benzoyl-CoA-dihydrodiol lyase [Beijerinckia sp. GAS462]SED27229.1 2,3-dihydro-2,3-dihydroxybenzoyl-CoA ring cleavage enzyme [Beijerinckia sp. 28-YEA-48]